MDFKEFKNKYFGKDLDYIKKNLKAEKDLFKKSEDVDNVKLCVDAQILADSLINIENVTTSLYLFKKMYGVTLYILENLTNVELIPEDESFDDYDYFVSIALIESTSKASFFSKMVEDIIKEESSNVLKELVQTFKIGLPSQEDITKLKEELDNMFKEESPEKLKTIENILAYNDPSMKQLKEMVYDQESLVKGIGNLVQDNIIEIS